MAFGGDGEEGDTDGSSGILSEDAEDNEKEDEFRKVLHYKKRKCMNFITKVFRTEQKMPNF